MALRRAWVAPVRADHAARRVLPDPRRAGDPPRAGRAHRRARTGRGHSSSSERARRRRPSCCSTRWTRPGMLERFVPLDVSEEVLRASARGGIRGSASTRSSATSSVTSRAVPDGASRLVAFLGSTIGNLEPARRARLLEAIGDGPRARRRGSSSASTSSRTRPGSRPPTTTPGASPRRSSATASTS